MWNKNTLSGIKTKNIQLLLDIHILMTNTAAKLLPAQESMKDQF